KGRRQADQIDDPCRVGHGAYQWTDDDQQPWQKQRDGNPGNGDDRLEQRVSNERTAQARAVPTGEPVAKRQPSHETREDDRDCPKTASKNEARSMEPDNLKDQLRRAREKKREGKRSVRHARK